MAKGTDDGKSIEKAQRKLAKAQLKLRAAQEQHAQARERGKQEVEQARLRAAEWMAAASEKVDRRVAKLEQAEARLLRFTAPHVPESRSSEDGNGTSLTAPTPEAAAEVLEQLEAETEPLPGPAKGALDLPR